VGDFLISSAINRIFDLITFTFVFIPVATFLLVLSLLTVIIYRFHPIFIQKRVGKDGCEFTCFKLQCLKPPSKNTLVMDAKQDQMRITYLGRLYRDHGWDELPQIINIFLGQMSFIGPRPILNSYYQRLLDEYPTQNELINSWKLKRLSVLPGLSGWHQIHLTDHNIFKYDMEYFQNPSLGRKFKIFMVSILILTIGKNNYYRQTIPETYTYDFK